MAGRSRPIRSRPGPRGRAPPRRRPRRDAELNRERILAAAVSVMLREGRHVPLAAIAAEAGVGVGTLYRSYADREARSTPSSTAPTPCSTRSSTRSRTRTCYRARSRQPVPVALPRHRRPADPAAAGAPPLVSVQAVQARRDINRRLDRFIELGRADGSIRATVNATDVIVFSALITQPLPHGPGWPLIAGRQLAIFVNGLAASGPTASRAPAVTRQDIEATFTLRAAPERPEPSPAR